VSLVSFCQLVFAVALHQADLTIEGCAYIETLLRAGLDRAGLVFMDLDGLDVLEGGSVEGDAAVFVPNQKVLSLSKQKLVHSERCKSFRINGVLI
jgi:hypothetical protein